MMIWLLLGIAIGVVFKVLVPIPALDDKIRELWSKLRTKAPPP